VPPRRRSFVGARRGPKRRTIWVGYAQQTGILVTDTTKTLISSFSLSTVDMVTVVRNRGLLSVRPSNQSLNLEPIGAFGIGIVSTQAFVAGIASIPGPFTNSDWEGWMVLMPYAFNWDVTTDVGRALTSVEQVIDSKAMRTMSSNETLVMVGESESGTVVISSPVRTLLKLA